MNGVDDARKRMCEIEKADVNNVLLLFVKEGERERGGGRERKKKV